MAKNKRINPKSLGKIVVYNTLSLRNKATFSPYKQDGSTYAFGYISTYNLSFSVVYALTVLK